MADKPRRVTLKEVGRSGWVKMMPAEYKAEWHDNPDWTIQDFGLYSLIDDLLYANGGMIVFETIEPISRLNREHFVQSWEKVCSKFNKSGDKIYHKSVLKALREARDAMQLQVDKGFRGSQFRWHGDSTGNSTGNSKGNADKSRLDKSRLDKKERSFYPPSLEQVEQYVKENGLSVNIPEFMKYYSESGWKDKFDNPVRNWKNKLRKVWDKPNERNNRSVSNSKSDRGQTLAKQKSGYGDTL